MIAEVLFLVTLAASEGAAAPRETDPARLFAYDAAAELSPRFEVVERSEGVVILEGSYASPGGDRVTAYLVTPEREQKSPAVLFGHWGGGNRTEFLPEAIRYARAGAVSLLPDYPWARPAPWRRSLRFTDDPEHDFPLYVQAVVDLRRGLDYLVSRPGVDASRLAYVGHSWGAQWGAILAAVDRRPRTIILMAGVPDSEALYTESDDPDFADLRQKSPGAVNRLLEVMKPLSAARYVGQAAPAPLYFQFARYEQLFARPSMERYYDAAPKPKSITWYPTGHDLNDPQALLDRAAWLQKHIGIGPVTPAGASSSSQDQLNAVREELKARYAENEAGFFARDPDRVMRLRHPEFHTITHDGKVSTREQMDQRTRDFIGRIERFDSLSEVIIGLTLEGDTAHAMVDQRTVRQQRLSDGTTHEVRTSVVQRESWKKTAGGWMMWRVDEIQPGQTLVDGKPVP